MEGSVSTSSTPSSQSDQLEENVRRIKQEIADACERADRDPEDVRICAVTKNRSVEAIRALHELGINLIGENRVQEAERKYRHLPEDGELHLVGHLQSNKTSLAVRLFDGMQSVDRIKIVDYLQRHCSKRDLELPVFIQVNASGEESKHGVSPDQVEPMLEEVVQADALQVQGFMTMAPYVEDPEDVRPIFARVRELRETYRDAFENVSLTELSMGMTQDFPIAVEEGATVVRVGRGFFQNTEWE